MAKWKVPEEVWRATHGNGGSVDIVGAQMTVRSFLREMSAHGFRLMPVAPTDAMQLAGQKATHYSQAWSLMYAAASEVEI